MDSIGKWISWIQYISPVANTNKALTQNEFAENVFQCGIKVGGNCIEINGEDIVKNFGLDTPDFAVVLGVNLAVLGFLIIAGIGCFTRTTKPMIRLN